MTTDDVQSIRNPHGQQPSPVQSSPLWFCSLSIPSCATINGFVSAGCKYNQVNSHFHCIREGCQFSFLLKHQMTSHARKHMRRMLGKNFDRVPTQVTCCVEAVDPHAVLALTGLRHGSSIRLQQDLHSEGAMPTLTPPLCERIRIHTPGCWCQD